MSLGLIHGRGNTDREALEWGENSVGLDSCERESGPVP